MQDYHFDEQLDQLPIAMAYVPWQHINRVYENLEQAYRTGTIFPELDKPFTGKRCCPNAR
ncbi:MAG: spore coat associated protein CotJA [Lachnospiraceae bacterium]|nr:spore coat associated protein CotJA [Lachnospiraceae bacterium]